MKIFGRKTEPAEDILRCSFCNKNQKDVKKLIAGPNVFICDECIAVCNEILANEDDGRIAGRRGSIEPTVSSEPPPRVVSTTRIVTCTLCHTQLPWEEALLVPERGALCPGCTGEIEAALAERGQGT